MSTRAEIGAKATLIMKPVAYKAGKLYSYIPNVVQGHTGYPESPGDFTFSRASEGSRTGPDGLIQTEAVDVPRLQYPSCPSVLLEPARTNLALWSEDFSIWTEDNASVDSNVIIAPDGAQIADKIISSAVDIRHFIWKQLNSIIATEVYAISIFAKAGEYGYLQISSRTGWTLNTPFCNFDLINGVVGNNNTTGEIKAYTDGWYKCTIYLTGLETGATYLIGGLPSDINSRIPAYLGDNVSGIYVWGTQVEQGSYPTNYIKTESASAVRAAESLSLSRTFTNDLTLFINVDLPDVPLADAPTPIVPVLGCFDGTIANRLYLNRPKNNGNEISANIVLGGVTLAATGNIANPGNVRLAMNVSSIESKIVLNGVEIASGSGGDSSILTDVLPYFSQLTYSATTEFNEIMIFDQKLTIAELIELTT